MAFLLFPKADTILNDTIPLLLQRQPITHEEFWRDTTSYLLKAAIRKYIRKVRGWERIRIAGKAATYPANETAGTKRQRTDKVKDSTRRVR
jgi:hypothetical protein